MDSFIRFEDLLLLEYDRKNDSFGISYDSGSSFPYELYENLVVNNQEYYIIYLESQDELPVTSKDIWIALEDALDFVKKYESKTEVGVNKMIELHTLLEQSIPNL